MVAGAGAEAKPGMQSSSTQTLNAQVRTATAGIHATR